MRAAVVPAVDGQWEVQEVPTPEPAVNQVLIKIQASALCYTDVHITKGNIPTQFPRTLGHEPFGEIVAIGEGVDNTQNRRSRRCTLDYNPPAVAVSGVCAVNGCSVPDKLVQVCRCREAMLNICLPTLMLRCCYRMACLTKRSIMSPKER